MKSAEGGTRRRPTCSDGLAGHRIGNAGGEEILCTLIRCIFGNPYCPLAPRSFPAHVVGLARSCSEAFPELSSDYSVLADALEELGEDQAAAHCRHTLHARGCHVLDWIWHKGETHHSMSGAVVNVQS
jgi:hypothetical protein